MFTLLYCATNFQKLFMQDEKELVPSKEDKEIAPEQKQDKEHGKNHLYETSVSIDFHYLKKQH